METERPHTRSNSNNSSTSELFICFTSRLSSSSMKISSKSILSPGRAREPSQISLSSSLSRRLRTNGSLKGGQSPMFPTTNGKKKGCAFENPEPSSPKVTCIGQVRVKTKKQGKKIRARSKRRGEVSFRKVDQSNSSTTSVEGVGGFQDFNIGHLGHQLLASNQQQNQQEGLSNRNQRWVHLPVTICEALRAFGAEFNCFLPCRSSCMAGQREKEAKGASAVAAESGGSSCGAVLARWLVATVQDGEGKGREIELVVGGGGGEERRESVDRRSLRRHVFDEIEFKEGEFEGKNGGFVEEEGRVSICIPPKNALLLMRCRSDPVKMAALANRFWECPVPQDHENGDTDCEDDGDKEEKGADKFEEEKSKVELEMEEKEEEVCEKQACLESSEEHHQIPEAEAEAELCLEERKAEETDHPENESPHFNEVREEISEKAEVGKEVETEETVLSSSSPEVLADPESLETEENEPNLLEENDDSRETEAENEAQEVIETNESEERRENISSDKECEENNELQEPETGHPETQSMAEGSTEEKETREEDEILAHERSEPECLDVEPGQESKERESEADLLPDCLLLMMCEPKLSMEVSKETWVCSTDFIRRHPEKPGNKIDDGDQPKTRVSIDSSTAKAKQNQLLLQPPRSSCSYPAAPPLAVATTDKAGGAPMATMIEQKLGGAKGYEPFALTRCKSEPRRSSAKLAPEACFWKNRKLEPHRPATRAAGVGF